jgi:hypothetical protein
MGSQSSPTTAEDGDRQPETSRLTENEARTLTRLIRERSSDLSILLLTAHKGRAWLALGYRSWEQYVRTEFSLSRSRSYELVDHGRVLQELRAETDLSAIADITPYDARRVKSRLAEVIDTIRAGVAASSNPQHARNIVATAIDDVRRQYDQDRRPAGTAHLGHVHKLELTNVRLGKKRIDFEALRGAFNGSDGDTLGSVECLYDALDYLARLPDPALVVKWIGKHQVDRIENVSRAAVWLARFDEAWKKHSNENGRARINKHVASV